MSPVAVIVLAYAIGSIPFALVLARQWGTRDLHHAGSGNLGAANVFRVSGPSAGILVAILDISKGAASVLLAERLSAGSEVPAVAGFAAIVGHIYPVSLKFRGGKGVATACGVFAVLSPLSVAIASVLFVATVWITKYISLGSIVGVGLVPLLAFATGSPEATVYTATAAAALIIFRHRSNVARLRVGRERRIGARLS